MIIRPKSGLAARREEIRKQYWPKEDLWTGRRDLWTGQKEAGWFPSPRTLPLVLSLLSSKEISNKKDPSSVYIELLSRQRGEGVIEMAHEADHAFASGYEGRRAIRTWQERIKVLSDNGFIRTKYVGDRLKYVAVVHPTTAVQRLRDAGKVSNKWWDAYVNRKTETGEPTQKQREERREAAKKVVPLIPVAQTSPHKRAGSK